MHVASAATDQLNGMAQQHMMLNSNRSSLCRHAHLQPQWKQQPQCFTASRPSRPASMVLRVARGAHQTEHDSQQGQEVQGQSLHRQAGVAEPPRPPEMLGLGHMLPMMGYLASGVQFETLMLKWRQEYGPFFEFKMPGNPCVVIVADPEAIKEVYEIKQYPKSPRYMDLLPIVGPQSMLLTEGHVWKSQREAFNPGFSSSFLKAALPGFVSSSQNLVEHLGAKADQQEVVLMHHVAVLTTLEIICKVGFGEDVDFLLSEQSTGLWSAFEGIGRHVAYFIDNVPLNWMKHLPWNQDKTRRLQAEYDRQLLPILLKRLSEMGIEVSAEEQQRLLSGQSSRPSSSSGKCPIPGIHTTSSSTSTAQHGSSSSSSGAAQCPMAVAASTEALMSDSRDILSLAVRLSQQQGAADGSGLDLEVLMSQMKTFFAAGHDTTASLIGWTMWFLMNHPEVEAGLVEEVLTVMGPDTQPSYQQLSEMRYLNAVLKESLRVRPPVGVLARYAPKGTTLAGYNVGEKVLLVSPYIQHMDKDVWGPDAEEFRPQRWLDPNGPAQHVSQYSYMPFSRGPRDCIGSRLALLEAKTILAMMYRHFEFEYAGEKPEEVLMSVTAHPKYGVPLRVRRRKAEQQQQEQQEQDAVMVGSRQQ